MWPYCSHSVTTTKKTRGPFLESPGSFSGPKLKFEIKIRRLVALVLAGKPVHFASLTDSYIVLVSKTINRRSWMQTDQTKTAFQARKVTGAFEKRAPVCEQHWPIKKRTMESSSNRNQWAETSNDAKARTLIREKSPRIEVKQVPIAQSKWRQPEVLWPYYRRQYSRPSRTITCGH